MSSYVGYQYDERTIACVIVDRDLNEKQDSEAAHNNVIDVCNLHFDTPLREVPKLGLVHRSSR